MFSTIATLIAVIAICAILWWFLQSVPLPEPARIAVMALMAIIAILFILRALGVASQ